MSAPSKLGWWVAFENAAHAGAKPLDLATIVDRCKRTGATWIAPRAGDASGGRDGAFDRASCEAYAAAGLDVYPWIFDRPGASGLARFLAQAESFRDWPGVKGVIINAEFEVLDAPASEAYEKVKRLRALGFDFVAHAPPDYAGADGRSAYLRALDDACDAIMPQVYAWEHNDRGHVHHLNAVRALYEKRRVDLAKVWPILCSYRPKVRGFDKAGKAIPTPPMANEAERVATDLIDGLGHSWTLASRAPSIYSLDAVTFINGASDRVMAALEAHAGAPSPKRRRIDDPFELQRALVALGFDIGRWGIDGNVGPATRAALAAYRASRGVDEARALDKLEGEYLALADIALPPDPRGAPVRDARALIETILPPSNDVTDGGEWGDVS